MLELIHIHQNAGHGRQSKLYLVEWLVVNRQGLEEQVQMVIHSGVKQSPKSMDVCRAVLVGVTVCELELASIKILANLNSVVSVLQGVRGTHEVNLNKVRGEGIHNWCA
jgi:hypothetical protein